MPTIVLETRIGAPIELCFDLARDLRLHTQTTGFTQERIIDGPESGLFGPGDRVTFEAVHFGVRQRLTALCTEFERPRVFIDRMERGAFALLIHRHEFILIDDDNTQMTDRLTFRAPFGILGRIAEEVFLTPYMRRFLQRRNTALKRYAEAQIEETRRT